MKKTIESHLYCMACGREGIPIQRKMSSQKEKFHRKKMYCPWCKQTLNFVQIRTNEELQEFMEKFEAGEFEEEAKTSLEASKSCLY